MQIRRLAALRPGRHRPSLLAVLAICLIAAACSSTPAPSGSPGLGSPVATPSPTPSPSPTPLPTPDFTNTPDPTLSALIPDTVDGAPVVKPDPTTFGVSPGDIGSVFGDIGLRFQSLVIGYIVKPRLSLYAVRVGGAAVDTADLQPYLVRAGVYVGASDRNPARWKAAVVNGNRVWTRGEDEATLPGTTFYCWSSGQYVFLMTGSSDATNQAMVSALPGQAAPTPSPSPSAVASGSTAASTAPTPAPSASGS